MRPLIFPEEMRAKEARYFKTSGIPSIEVMERAAQALAGAVRAQLAPGARVYFACGTGGNGGDGLACARLLREDFGCTVILPEPPKSPDAIANLKRLGDVPVLTSVDDLSGLPAPDAWVDALFGTGLSRAPREPYARLIRRIQTDHLSGSRVFAADIPSGLNGATGQAYDPCVCADETVTFQYIKTGMALADGLDACGRITVADVGFPREAFEPVQCKLWDVSDAARWLTPRKHNIHKGTCGHLLILAGSFGMAGAAVLCASAALRSGAGLVTVACVRSIVPILQTLVPQAMCIPLEERDGAIAAEALPEVRRALKGKDAAVFGCGLSRRAAPETLEAVLTSGLPAVIDADGLNLLSEHPEWTKLLAQRHVLTPHPGEAARLIPGLDTSDPIAAAQRLGELGATILLKGAATVVAADGEVAVSASGCCGMARGGSGDILSGILGALMADRACRVPALDAIIASELHGLAGERAQAKYGSRAMNARDILEFLPEVFPA